MRTAPPAPAAISRHPRPPRNAMTRARRDRVAVRSLPAHCAYRCNAGSACRLAYPAAGRPDSGSADPEYVGSQAALALDLVPGRVDPCHFVIGTGNELSRHSAGGQTVRMVLAHQPLPGGANDLGACRAWDAKYRVCIRLFGRRRPTGTATARTIPGILIQ